MSIAVREKTCISFCIATVARVDTP